MLATFVLGALSLTGCGYSCEDMCEDLAECEGSPEVNPDDCDPRCEIQERMNEDFGCDDEFDEYVDCVGELDDPCDVWDTSDDENSPCSDENGEYYNCVFVYCDAHPNNDDCAPLRGP
jgi:hypothetical protein